MFSAIVLAGGNSTRMGGINKQTALLNDIPVIIHSLAAFEKSSLTSEIILVVPNGGIEEFSALCRKYSLNKLKAAVCGGSTRFLSVKNALARVSERCEYIAVHDGARPLISAEDIDRVLQNAVKFGASIAAAPVNDTIKICGGEFIEKTADRSRLFAAQTPQAFNKKIYLECVEKLGEQAEKLTDDSQLFELCGHKVHITEITAANLKITRRQDLAIARALSEEQNV